MKALPKTDHYTYRVTWSQEDGQCVGLCAEFPSLSWLAPAPEKALRGIRKLVADVVKDLKANGEPVPEPLSSRRYSGKFMVRVPPEVHHRLVVEAAEEDISLNRLVSAKLSS
jgi:predicted HicB family RNase H-like nuclease